MDGAASTLPSSMRTSRITSPNFEKLLTLIRPGGLIAVDNTLGLSRTPIIRMTSENAQAIKEFNRRVHRDPRVEIAMLPVGEGLTLMRVVR
jgi:predicted O-methyltransferase YrrM